MHMWGGAPVPPGYHGAGPEPDGRSGAGSRDASTLCTRVPASGALGAERRGEASPSTPAWAPALGPHPDSARVRQSGRWLEGLGVRIRIRTLEPELSLWNRTLALKFVCSGNRFLASELKLKLGFLELELDS